MFNQLDDNQEFKNSALGMIPKDWEILSFKNITNVRQGLQIAISKRFKEYKPNRYIYITVEYVNNLDDQASTEFIEAPSKRVICYENDILFTRTGATGKIITGIEGVFHNNFFLVDYDKSKVFREYFLHYLNFEPIQKDIQFKAGITTIPDLKHGDFYSLIFLKPTLPQQQQIAKILDTVDKAIAQTETLIAKYKRVKTGLMQDLLTRGIDEHGQLRDPRTHKFKRSPLGMIPDEWEVKSLSTIADVSSGVTLGRKVTGLGTIELPYLRVANVQDGYLDLSDVKTIHIYKEELSRYLLQPNDVLMNEGGDYDKLGRGTVWRGQIPLCLHQNHVFRVRPNTDYLFPDFLAFISASSYGKNFFILNSKQSTNLASINSTQLKSFPIPSPPVLEQKKIIAIYEKIEVLIKIEQRKYNNLQKIKTGLMQDLLTGKTSVKPLLTNQP